MGSLTAAGAVGDIPAVSDRGRLLGSHRTQLLHLLLLELEVAGLLLRKVGQVEGDADEVRLSGVVALIVVIIDDDVVTVILGRRDVLEVIQVERVCQDIVRVHALQGLTLCHGLCL